MRYVTVSCTTVDSYLEASPREAGAAAELAASHNMAKYAGLSSSQGAFTELKFIYVLDVRFVCMCYVMHL